MNIGDTVCISGNHPHAGKTGKLEGCYRILGKDAVKIEFSDHDGCFVFRDKDVKLIPVRIGK